MPRKRRRRGRKKKDQQEDYPARTKNEMDSGETMDPNAAPVDIEEVFVGDEDDDIEDFYGNQDPDKFFPPQKGAGDIPEPPGSQPKPPEYAPPTMNNADFDGGEYLMTDPVTKPNVSDDRRVHLTWIANKVSIETKDVEGQISTEITVKARLCAAVYELVPIEQGGRREPVLQVMPLMKDPIDLMIPLWLLPSTLAQNPDQISLAQAEKILAQMFTSFPTEIIKPPPKPAAAERIPSWLLQKMKEQKGPVNR